MPTLETPLQKITFQRGLAAQVGKDGFSDLTLITGGVEALGHGIFVDEQSIEGLMTLLMGKSIPGYLTHDGAIFGDRLGKEIGIFSGFFRDGLKLKAKTFKFLNSFIKNDVEDYEKLVELAELVPDQFGLSVVFSGKAVWVMAEDEGEIDADMPMPEGALRGVPSIRFSSVESADFVKAPAANPDGLFHAKVDEKNNVMTKPALSSTGSAQGGALIAETATTGLTVIGQPETTGLTVIGQPWTITLSAHNYALAEKETKITELNTALKARDDAAALMTKDHDAALSALRAEQTSALAEKETEITSLKEQLASAKRFDVRKSGVRTEDIPNSGEPGQNMRTTFASDKDRWGYYHELLEKNETEAAESFRLANLVKRHRF